MIDLFHPRFPTKFNPSFVNMKLHIEPIERRSGKRKYTKKIKVKPKPSKRLATPKTSEYRRAQMRANYLANKAKYIAKARKWCAENPEKTKESCKQSERRRRLRKTGKCLVHSANA